MNENDRLPPESIAICAKEGTPRASPPTLTHPLLVRMNAEVNTVSAFLQDPGEVFLCARFLHFFFEIAKGSSVPGASVMTKKNRQMRLQF